MSFPTVTTVIDNFNRGSIGSNWTGPLHFGSGLVISASTILASSSGYTESAYTATSYGPDCDLYFDIVAIGTSGSQPGLYLRTSTGTVNGYLLLSNFAGVGLVIIARVDNNANTQLGAFVAQSFSNGDKIGFNATGSTLTAYQYTGGVWGSAILSRTDTTYTAAGYFGATVDDATLDNMSGGTVAGTNYSRGDYSALPTDDSDLENIYSASDITDVATSNNVRVAQTASGQYAVHLYKSDVTGLSSITITWEGQTNYAPASSTVYLQVYNRNSTTWETLNSDSASAVNTDFTITGNVATLTNYKDGSNIVAWRIYQQAT